MYQVSRCSRPCHVTAIDDHLGTWAVAIHGRRDCPAFRAQIGRASLLPQRPALPLPFVLGWDWACTATHSPALSSAPLRLGPEIAQHGRNPNCNSGAGTGGQCLTEITACASAVAVFLLRAPGIFCSHPALRPHGRVVNVSISYIHGFVYKCLKLSRSANPSSQVASSTLAKR